VVQKAPDRFDLDPQLKARGYYVDLPHSQIGACGRRRSETSDSINGALDFLF
jgi:hypothetical protein